MQFTLTVNMDNADFDDKPGEALESILTVLALRFKLAMIRGLGESGNCFDSNGNTVGEWSIS